MMQRTTQNNLMSQLQFLNHKNHFLKSYQYLIIQKFQMRMENYQQQLSIKMIREKSFLQHLNFQNQKKETIDGISFVFKTGELSGKHTIFVLRILKRIMQNLVSIQHGGLLTEFLIKFVRIILMLESVGSMMSQVANQQDTYPIRVGGRLNCINSEYITK